MFVIPRSEMGMFPIKSKVKSICFEEGSFNLSLFQSFYSTMLYKAGKNHM